MSHKSELANDFVDELEVHNHQRPVIHPRDPAHAFHAPISSDADHEEMTQLVQRVFLSANGIPPRTIVFCGVDSENGSSTVCARAGSMLATNTGKPVCIVDANARLLCLSEMFRMSAPTTLDCPPGSIRNRCVQFDKHLWVAKFGVLAGNDGVIPPMHQLKELLTQLRGAFDYVLIDAPGINSSGDTPLLSQAADATILVIEANQTRRISARKAKDTLDEAGVALLGTVLHNRSFPIPTSLYRRL